MSEFSSYSSTEHGGPLHAKRQAILLEPNKMHRIYGSIKGAASKSVQERLFVIWDRVEAKVVHLVPERLKDVLELSPIICSTSRGEILLTPSFDAVSTVNPLLSVITWSACFKINEGEFIKVYDQRNPEPEVYEFRLRERQASPLKVDTRGMEAALCIWTSSTLSSRLKDLTSLRVQNSCLFFTAEFSFVNLQNNEVPKKFRLFLNGEELAFEERVEPIITDDIDSKFSRDPNTHRATHSLAIEVNPGDRLEILSLMNDKLADSSLEFF